MGAVHAVLWAGMICGILDIISVLLLYGIKGGSPVRLLQGIAGGLLGARAFQGGIPIAALGLALHFVIALGAATVFYLASRELPILIERAILFGVLYGIAVFVVMNFVVLPLSAVAKRPFSLSAMGPQLIIHMIVVGPSIALMIRRFSQGQVVR
jgi:hypothetical protein